MANLRNQADYQSRTDAAKKNLILSGAIGALGLAIKIILILSFSFGTISNANAQNKASASSLRKDQKQVESNLKNSGVWSITQEQSLDQWKKFNEMTPEARQRAIKMIQQSGMFTPDPEAKTYSSYAEFQKAQAANGWMLPKRYEDTQKARIITTTIPKNQ